jgi:hypothetical protein
MPLLFRSMSAPERFAVWITPHSLCTTGSGDEDELLALCGVIHGDR